METSWDIRLREQRERNFKNYLPFTLDLSIARTNQEYPIPGDCLQVLGVSSLSAIATVKFNLNTNEAVTLKKYTKIKPDVFTSFYITNEAQAGESMDILVGINFEIQNVNVPHQGETQPAIIITNATPDANTVGASHICNRAIVRAHWDNTGKAWLNCGAVAVAVQCWELAAGDAVSLPISNTNRINVLFTVANDKVTVLYEV